jgi:hypothetical protein
MMEVGSNPFWFRRKERPIRHIDILISQYDRSNEFGIEIFLEGVDSFVIEYANEAPSFDQLRITGLYEGPQCERVRVF